MTATTDLVSEAAHKLVAALKASVADTGARLDSLHPTSFGCSAYVRGGSPVVQVGKRKLYTIIDIRVSDHGVGERRCLTDGQRYIDVHGDVDAQIAREVEAFVAHYNGLLAQAAA